MTDLITLSSQTTTEAERMAAEITKLSEGSRAVVQEILDALSDLRDRDIDPQLRHVIHAVFERSVAEFFSVETATSTQLPDELVRHTLPDPDAIALPEPQVPDDADLSEILARRRSRRDFANRPMTMQELGDVLHMSLARNSTEDGYGTRDMPLFPYPSIGGLDAVHLGVIVQRVDGLENGYYVYDKIGHGLVRQVKGDMRMALVDATFESEWLFYAPVVLVLANDQRKVSWKYHTRGYRISMLDLGAALQNLYLASTATGMSCCAVAGYHDTQLNDLLRYPKGDLSVGVLVSIGPPGGPGAEAPTEA